MLNTLLAKKEEMSQTFLEGKRVAVTWVTAGPCVITRISQTGNIWNVQIGFGEKKIKNLSKPLQGHLRGVIKDNKAPRFLLEIKLNEEPKYKPGDLVTLADLFLEGDRIDVRGTSKGKGFAGVVKRYHFKGGPRTHGQSDRERAPGSIGQTTTPGRVLKGKRMAGRMGQDRVTVKNLKVIKINSQENKLAISGPVPGSRDSILVLTKV